ncbi:MAG: hypothetical protein ACLRWQ_04725 [Flavonifractor plautii]
MLSHRPHRGAGEEPLELDALGALAEPGFYSVTLRDQTTERRDAVGPVGEDTLTGLFLRQMQAQLEALDEGRRLELAVRFGLAALENGEDPCL